MIPTTFHDPDDIHDQWALTNNGYAIDKFYCRASDSRGHSDMVHVKMTPGLHSQMNMLIHDDGLDYRTHADLVRDAVTHRVRWLLEQQRAGVDLHGPLWEMEVHISNLAEKKRMREIERTAKEDTWEEVRFCINDDVNNVGAAWEIIDEYESVVLEHPDQDHRRRGMTWVREMRAYVETAKRDATTKGMRAAQ